MTPEQVKEMVETGMAPCGCKVDYMDIDWQPCDPGEAVHQIAYHDKNCADKQPPKKK